jgi:D-sedoheptulose 7-phosphate isomerase
VVFYFRSFLKTKERNMVHVEQAIMVVRQQFVERADLNRIMANGLIGHQIMRAVWAIVNALRAGKKVLVFGNGGSAAEAQHFVAELVGRFEKDRQGFAAIALTTDTSILTAQANDAGYETVFSRQIEALAHPGDIVVALTTSDVQASHSENIKRGLMTARAAGCITIGLFSERTRQLLSLTDVHILVPHRNTALIQEVHLAILHIIARLVEEELS